MAEFEGHEGVWRTIGGRRVFIRDGEDLSSAMQRSGKFSRVQKKQNKKEEMNEAEKYYEKLDEKDILNDLEERKNRLENDYYDEKDKEKYQKFYEDGKKYYEEKFGKKEGSPIEDLVKEKGINVGGRLREVDNEAKEFFKALDSMNLDEDRTKFLLHSRYPESNEDNLLDKYKEWKTTNGNEETKDAQNYRKEMANAWKQLNDGKIDLEEYGAKKDEIARNNKYGKMEADYNDTLKEITKSKENNSTNYRNQITNVAKNSKEDNVTLDVETGKPVSFEKGYSVSFQQSSDTYSDEEYAEKVTECKNKCDGKVYAGKYGGDAEASFHTDNLDDAKELMYKYNQESIYDWENDTLIMNDRYEASKNKTNYKKEKTTNEIMNENIRQKAGKKTYKEDLPKKVEIKSQGTSNRKEVSENIQAHILDYYESPSDFISQMDNMNAPTKWHAGEELAKGGNYMIYYDEQREFLDNLKINPKGKKFSDDKVFSTYTSLIGRESAKLYDRLKKNSYKKYMLEHPNSKMTFNEFKNMEKGV